MKISACLWGILLWPNTSTIDYIFPAQNDRINLDALSTYLSALKIQARASTVKLLHNWIPTQSILCRQGRFPHPSVHDANLLLKLLIIYFLVLTLKQPQPESTFWIPFFPRCIKQEPPTISSVHSNTNYLSHSTLNMFKLFSRMGKSHQTTTPCYFRLYGIRILSGGTIFYKDTLLFTGFPYST